MSVAEEAYLDLMKRCLTNVIYQDARVVRSAPFREISGVEAFDAASRRQGEDWPSCAHTMVGLERLNNLQACIENVLSEGVPGDFIEAGVWRGGATIFMRAVLKVKGVKDRRVWAADSFEGLPSPNPAKYPLDSGLTFNQYSYLAVSLEAVQENFRRYDLLDEQVVFLKGWFRDTLPGAPIEQLAVIRIDGDLYESTMDALVNLYPKLSVGGYLIVDDYNDIPACRQAVIDYRHAHAISSLITPIDWTGVYWRRE
jgi:hypothetical protein